MYRIQGSSQYGGGGGHGAQNNKAYRKQERSVCPDPEIAWRRIWLATFEKVSSD